MLALVKLMSLPGTFEVPMALGLKPRRSSSMEAVVESSDVGADADAH